MGNSVDAASVLEIWITLSRVTSVAYISAGLLGGTYVNSQVEKMLKV